MAEKKIIVGKTDALTIIDGQNDFIKVDGALYVAGVDGEISSGCIMSDIKAPLTLFPFGHKATTEDDHPENHVEFDIFGRHCVHGTPGQKYHSAMWPEYRSADENIKKGQHSMIISYSIVTSPQFPEHIVTLRLKGIKRVFVVGWAYTHCVGESAIAYACQGFETYVIRDLTKSVPPPYGDPEKMKKKLKLYGVKEIFLEDIE